MRNSVAVSLALALCAALGGAQERSEPRFWKGKFEVFQFQFMYGVGVQDRSFVTRSAQVWETDYDLFESQAGVVREQLTHMNWHPSAEGPMDIRLLDYSRGYGLVFDKDSHRPAIRGPLVPPVTGVPVEQRQILGFNCDGREYDWTTSQGARVRLQRWSARGSDLKVPLLQLEYFTDDTGALLSLRVALVSQMDRASDLPASLFEPPSGLHPVDVPSIE